jgi:hypothetical protein
MVSALIGAVSAVKATTVKNARSVAERRGGRPHGSSLLSLKFAPQLKNGAAWPEGPGMSFNTEAISFVESEH